ncbi:transcription factor PRE6 [Artemisia annua]|uniref:Transcription factor PRE6 n=1 Tax=Artemisia annua TaxID=35608 RepID=A0A2U1N5J4_ARTAN|nr:transcription factor PRE6 [Artemisia annua]
MYSPRKRASKHQAHCDDELADLVLKLQALLPTSSSKGDGREKMATSKIIQETCNYIKRLQKEVNIIGERLSQLLDSMENDDLDMDILRNLLQQ